MLSSFRVRGVLESVSLVAIASFVVVIPTTTS